MDLCSVPNCLADPHVIAFSLILQEMEKGCYFYFHETGLKLVPVLVVSKIEVHGFESVIELLQTFVTRSLIRQRLASNVLQLA